MSAIQTIRVWTKKRRWWVKINSPDPEPGAYISIFRGTTSQPIGVEKQDPKYREGTFEVKRIPISINMPTLAEFWSQIRFFEPCPPTGWTIEFSNLIGPNTYQSFYKKEFQGCASHEFFIDIEAKTVVVT